MKNTASEMQCIIINIQTIEIMIGIKVSPFNKLLGMDLEELKDYQYFLVRVYSVQKKPNSNLVTEK